MLLMPEDAAMFYRAWGALLTWVNERRNVVPHFPPPTADRPIDPSLVNPIRKLIWADDSLREQFLAEGPSALGREERELVSSWTHRVSRDFIVFRHLRKHSVFLSDGVYGVLGIYTPLEVMIPCVPAYVQATLLPFGNVIITDGLLESPGVQISFGGGARRGFNRQYGTARDGGQVQTMLPWRPAAGPRAIPARSEAPRRRGRRRAPEHV